MLTERVSYDAITILEDGQIQLRRARVVLDTDGVTEIARTFHREVIEPGQSVATLPPRVRDICGAVWTPAVVATYAAQKAARNQRP